MASTVLPREEQNFIRFVKICQDVLKLPLIDILASEIQPADLYNEIQQHKIILLNGRNKLDTNQLKICFLPPPAVPDYKTFDVTLLYKLIRNLCPSLEPTQGWGNDPVDTDTQIGDDIERLRFFRNNNVHHSSSMILDTDFEIIWRKLKSVFQRIKSHMTSKGYNANYEEKMVNIKQLDLGDETIDKYKMSHLFECTIDRLNQEEPNISIQGQDKVLCGDAAIFNTVVSPEHANGWSVTWQKLEGLTCIHINTRTEKYTGSTGQKLVMHSVCKEDEGEYRAILSRFTNRKETIVPSNSIFLQAIGDIPKFDVWEVRTGVEGINICYSFKKEQPYVNEIKWTKDGKPIDYRNKQYNGGELRDNYFTITSPTYEDRGIYSCIAKNAVGTTKNTVTLDVPNVEISTEQQIYFGSKTTLTSKVLSCPSPDGVEWQESNSGQTFDSIDITKPKYYGSSCNPKSPLLVMPKVTFIEKLNYRLLVWNKIGEQYSNTVFLDVIGSLPNITISHKTCVSNRSITLSGDVFLYESFPAVQNVFWTKDGKKLDTEEIGGKCTEVRADDLSLTILEVNKHDKGSYQLTATNAVGSTSSDIIILGVPDVSFEQIEKKNDGSLRVTVTIKAIPAPNFVRWSKKEKTCDTFVPIDENLEEFKGTSSHLPHPVLVFKPNNDLENYCFQIEVKNFIGSCEKSIPDETSSDDSFTNGNQVEVKNFIGSCKKSIPDETSSDDSFTNGNQVGLSAFYSDRGSGLNFSKLIDDIAEQIPKEKTKRFKDFIRYSQKVDDMTLFAQVVSVRDCLEILYDYKLFTPCDVIFIQYLLKNTKCMDLFDKCVAYAEAHEALCFYEKLPEKGFQNVQFHVRANLSNYTPYEIKQIQETVAAIVGCNSTEIVVSGYHHSSSFLVDLSIEKKHVRKLLTMKQQEKDKLRRLNIDYFIVDFSTVYLDMPEETRRKSSSELNVKHATKIDEQTIRSKVIRRKAYSSQIHVHETHWDNGSNTETNWGKNRNKETYLDERMDCDTFWKKMDKPNTSVHTIMDKKPYYVDPSAPMESHKKLYDIFDTPFKPAKQTVSESRPVLCSDLNVTHATRKVKQTISSTDIRRKAYSPIVVHTTSWDNGADEKTNREKDWDEDTDSDEETDLD